MAMQSLLVGSAVPACELPERSTATYHPSVWGDTFISHITDEATLFEWREKAESLKGKVRKMLICDEDNELPRSNSAKLSLIDAMQRLGVAYHFEEEIRTQCKELARVFTGYDDQIHNDVSDDEDADLRTVALRFRLLRKQGYNVTCDIFKKFMDNKGNFKKSLCEDVHGLLNLYEASYLRVQGEVILDDALEFATSSLLSLLPHLSPFLGKQVLRALSRPLRKTLPRVDTRNYISVYEQMEHRNEILLGFAKLDFNMVERVDIKKNFKFVRDRIVECYFWTLGVYTEPHYARARRFLTQVIALITILDDTYDNYGTRDELELLTIAIDRWDIRDVVDLPEYMKVTCLSYFKLYREAEEEMLKQGKPIYGVESAKEALKILTKAYLGERKWLEKQDFPTVEEYKKVSFVSTGYPMLSVTSVVFMGDEASTEEAFEWLLTIPKPAMAATKVCRLMDDIVSHKFERKRIHPPSTVECYIAQYGMSKEEACDALRVEIEGGWKDLNEALLRRTPVSKSVLMRMLNLARVMEFLYKNSDGFTHVTREVKECITCMLITSVNVKGNVLTKHGRMNMQYHLQ